MRIARTARLLATTAAAALVVGLAAAGPVQAVPVTTVDAVTFSSPSLSVSGLAMSAQTITAHIVDPAPTRSFLRRTNLTGCSS